MTKELSTIAGTDRTALNNALKRIGYLVPIGDPVTIGSPVANVDFMLPTGYVGFELKIFGLLLDADDIMAAVFSSDGGSTWFNDTDSFTSYDGLGSGIAHGAFGDGSGGADSAMELGTHNNANFISGGDPVSAPVGYGATISIDPGNTSCSAGVTALIHGVNTHPQGGVFAYNLIKGTGFLNRMNAIRISAYNSGNLSTPRAGCLTAGRFYLSGIPE